MIRIVITYTLNKTARQAALAGFSHVIENDQLQHLVGLIVAAAKKEYTVTVCDAWEMEEQFKVDAAKVLADWNERGSTTTGGPALQVG